MKTVHLLIFFGGGRVQIIPVWRVQMSHFEMHQNNNHLTVFISEKKTALVCSGKKHFVFLSFSTCVYSSTNHLKRAIATSSNLATWLSNFSEWNKSLEQLFLCAGVGAKQCANQCLGTTPGSLFKAHYWWCLGNPTWCWDSNQGQLYAR